MLFRSISIAAVLLGLVGYSADGATILSSDFNSQTSVNGGSSFTGINWSTDPALTASSSIALSSGATVQQGGASANSSRLAVAHNIDTAGPFTLTVSVTIDAGHDVSLSSLSFDYQFISNAGVNQAAAHPNSGIFTLNVLDSTSALLGTANVGPLGTSSASSNLGSTTITLGTPVSLLHGETYSLDLGVSSNSSTGNNVSVDNFAFEGSSSIYTPPATVPEPASFTTAVIGVIGALFIARSRCRLAS